MPGGRLSSLPPKESFPIREQICLLYFTLEMSLALPPPSNKWLFVSHVHERAISAVDQVVGQYASLPLLASGP